MVHSLASSPDCWVLWRRRSSSGFSTSQLWGTSQFPGLSEACAQAWRSGPVLVTPVLPPLPPMVLPSCFRGPLLCLSSLLSLPRYLCWVDRDLRLSKFVTNFLLFTDTLSLPTKRRGDGSREDSGTGLREEAWRAGVWRGIPGPVPVAWGPLPCPRIGTGIGTGSGCGAGVGRSPGGQGRGARCAHLSAPHSAAVVNAISLYMRHLGVRTKSGDKKSGRNFFRKKVLP